MEPTKHGKCLQKGHISMTETEKQRENEKRTGYGCLTVLVVVLLFFLWQEWSIQTAINKTFGCRTDLNNFEISSHGFVTDKSCIETTFPPTWDIGGIISGHVTTTCDIQIIVFGYSYNFVLQIGRASCRER